MAVAFAVLWITGRVGAPSDSSAEAGFARDMATHHAQAVEMSFTVRDATTAEDVRDLAGDILTGQATQRGMFMGWLQQWGLDQGSIQPRMAWMAGHGHGQQTTSPGTAEASGQTLMPGMLSDADMKRLADAKAKDAEILYLQLMIRHHEGGVEMAEAALKLSDDTQVTGTARHIVNSQTGEIKLMTDMLAKRGAQPLPTGS
ncbi:DUF305 domain-containing protein [Sinosporangium album]|uniref:DUF305 domain-containing protein n=1 Tax=Sinosporangium album TaxID=504805 RepID=UPI001FE24272|nr:DUF305 domain-containing protein [Sinosporangium album]